MCEEFHFEDKERKMKEKDQRIGREDADASFAASTAWAKGSCVHCVWRWERMLHPPRKLMCGMTGKK